ncbi:MAG: nuclease A inhibitor family protein [Bacteroidia bacterium]|nr:nuclease A inhibitor family protein [Bacteroidia bacterium]MDW8158575.1 nuclease A inhibitor family protein [Bacteroidia bacterium]
MEKALPEDIHFYFNQLQRLSCDLLLLSETDAPFEIIWFTVEQKDFLAALKREGLIKRQQEVKEVSLWDFFKNYIEPQDWDTEEDKKIRARFSELYSFFSTHLEQSKVFRVGKIEITIFILGFVPGTQVLLGLKSLLVET